MDTNELRAIQTELDWSWRDLARYAKRDYSRIRKMASGADPVDAALADWLRRVVAAQREYDRLTDAGVPLKRP